MKTEEFKSKLKGLIKVGITLAVLKIFLWILLWIQILIWLVKMIMTGFQDWQSVLIASPSLIILFIVWLIIKFYKI